MNNKIKAAVAGAVLASASVANAGIVWDAGEWTVDMNGNVNAFVVFADQKDTQDQLVVLQRLKQVVTLIVIVFLSLQVFYLHG